MNTNKHKWIPLLLVAGLFLLPTEIFGQSEVHVVKKGESLYSIAREYNISLAELREWNNLEGNIIEVGQKIIVSDSSDSRQTYEVKPGDTLFGISKKFGVSIASLKEWNNLSGNTLKVGQRLTIYESGKEKLDDSKLASTQSGNDPSPISDDDRETKNYIVKSGDTLYDIARSYNMTVAELKALNDLAGNQIRVGQRLTVASLKSAPSVGGASEDEISLGSFRPYRVSSGENLSAILHKFKMDTTEFLALNPEIAPNEISRGLQVTVLAPPSKTFKNPYRSKAKLQNLGETATTVYNDSQAGTPVTGGGLYNPEMLSAAHANISLGSVIFVENPENGRGVFVVVNDRVTTDNLKLSQKAYEVLALDNASQSRVKIYKEQQ